METCRATPLGVMVLLPISWVRGWRWTPKPRVDCWKLFCVVAPVRRWWWIVCRPIKWRANWCARTDSVILDRSLECIAGKINFQAKPAISVRFSDQNLAKNGSPIQKPYPRAGNPPKR